MAFDLYATHGLPFEIARDVAREQGLDIEESGFQQAMEEHRLSSGAGKAFGAMGGERSEIYSNLLKKLNKEDKLPNHEIKYDPYVNTTINSQVIAILVEGEEISKASPGEKVEIVLPETCFYIESGGQVSDTGSIHSKAKNPWEIRIDDVKKPAAGMIIHVGEVIKGNPKVGDKAIVEVDAGRHRDIIRNHTATHLLHAELRKVLGEQVRQAGSLVAPDRLRFDFTQNEQISEKDLEKVEDGVNQAILADYPVVMEIKPLIKAKEDGAMALFGEKYGESVRTISIGDESKISYELCGGTHVTQTGDIGTFIILGEFSVASGIRRIEAVTGGKAYEVIKQRMKILHQISSKLSISIENSFERVENLIIENEKKIKEIDKLKENLAEIEFENNKNKDLQKIGQSSIYITNIGYIESESLRKLADKFKLQYPSSVLTIGTNDLKSGRVTILVSITNDLVKTKGLNAVELVKEVGALIGGGGGGKPTLAQAGGSDGSKLSIALQKIRELVNSKL